MNDSAKLDDKIFELLRDDGRISNREIGRILNVSEATVRNRIRNLKESKVMRLGIVTNPRAMGLAASAFVRINADPSASRRVCEMLALMTECNFVALTLGHYEIITFVTTSSRDALRSVIDNKIIAMAGVRDVDVRELVEAVKHRYDLVRIK
jgi:DNA-binding Lrp family transcriptional regulator